MAISNAVNLANLSSKDTFVVDSVNDRVGIASTTPTEALTVVGVVSATSFFGDGSNLEGVASAGLGTALGDGTNGLEVIYFTDKVLTISDTITVDPPATTNIAYTQYSEIAVDENKDLIVADGDDLVPDILGLSTEGVTPLVGAGGRVRADNFTNKAGNGAPNFPSGLTGTTGTFSGTVSGATGTFTGSVSVGGTITYEDVTNVDSVGIITARTGVKVLAGGANIVGVTTAASGLVVSSGGISIVGGGATVAGIATFHDGADIEGFKIEDGQTAATPNGEFNFYLASGHFFRYTGTPGADYYPNFKHSASINLNDRMDVNDVVTATLAVNSPAVTYHIANTIHIDGNATGENSYTIDTDWVGGSAPDAGNGSGHDIYSFTIIKTADKTFTILANALGAA